jgi:hypothetical protein
LPLRGIHDKAHEQADGTEVSKGLGRGALRLFTAVDCTELLYEGDTVGEEHCMDVVTLEDFVLGLHQNLTRVRLTLAFTCKARLNDRLRSRRTYALCLVQRVVVRRP